MTLFFYLALDLLPNDLMHGEGGPSLGSVQKEIRSNEKFAKGAEYAWEEIVGG